MNKNIITMENFSDEKHKLKEVEENLYYGATAQTFLKAEILKINMTVAETLLWERLKKNQLLELSFQKQHPINIYIVDFYCHEQKLVIEIENDTHRFQPEYYNERTRIIEKFGLKVIRVKNSEVVNNIESVLNKIKNAIKKFDETKSVDVGLQEA